MVRKEDGTREMVGLLENGPNNEDGEEKTGNRIDKIKGLLAKLLEVLLYVVSATCVQLLKRKIPDFELNTFRFGITFLMFLLKMVISRELPVVPKSEITGTFSFGLITCFDTACMYIAVSILPVSSAESIMMTCMILFGFILLSIFWDER